MAKSDSVFILIFLMLLFLSLTAHYLYWRDPWIGGDGVAYYAYIRSVVIDGDLDFYNEFTEFNPGGHPMLNPHRRTPTGLVGNWTTIGTSILWSPFFMVGHLAAQLLSNWDPSIEANGYSLPYGLSILIANLFYGCFGLRLVSSISAKHYSPPVPVWAASTIGLASPLFYYLTLETSMSHPTAMFVVAVFVYIWLQGRPNLKLQSAILEGGLIGLMMLVRPQLGLFGILPLLDAVSAAVVSAKRKDWMELKRLCSRMIALTAAALLVFAPQMIVWQKLYGALLVIPQTWHRNEAFLDWTNPQIFQVLFSWRHGLFTWTPIILLAVMGLILFARQHRRLGMYLIIALVLQLYMNAIAKDWWAGYSFGARRFISCIPILGLGLAALGDRILERRPVFAVGLSCIAIIWNVSLVMEYFSGMIPHGEAVTLTEMLSNVPRIWRGVVLVIEHLLRAR